MTGLCGAREREPRTGTSPCVLPAGHDGDKHQDKWTNQWPVPKGVTADHRPEPWFWEAGSEHCPHGAEPDRESDAWKVWSERHDGSPQDTVICLDAPMGDHCPECSADHGDAVPWADCPRNSAARPGYPRSAWQMLADYGLHEGVIKGVLEVHAHELTGEREREIRLDAVAGAEETAAERYQDMLHWKERAEVAEAALARLASVSK